MSTDPTGGAPGHGDQGAADRGRAPSGHATPTRRPRRAADHRLRRRTVAVVTVLAVVGALAAVVGSTQGPRLRDVSYSATDLVARPAQRVILTANQALQPVRAADVHVTPAAPHTVTSSGNAVAVEFAGPLAYDSRYTITVSDVRAPGQAATSTLRTTVRTGSTDVLALVPGADGAPDQVVRRPLDAAGNDRVYAARGIETFAVVGRTLAVLHDDASGDSAIDLVPLGADGTAARGTDVEHLTMPSRRGHASALHVASDGASLGFVWADTTSGRSQDVGLYVVDLTGTHMPTAVDASGKPEPGAVPLTVSQWAYVPRSESALVRTGDDQLLLVDMSGRTAVVRLGSATYLHGFVGNGTTAVVEGGSGVQQLDLTDGERSALPQPALASASPYVGRIAALTDRSYLRVVGSYGEDGLLDARLVRVDGSAAERLAVQLPADGSVTAVCPSPNGELAAVTTRSQDSSLVTIVDASTGALEASIAGTTVDWCESLPSGDDPGAG